MEELISIKEKTTYRLIDLNLKVKRNCLDPTLLLALLLRVRKYCGFEDIRGQVVSLSPMHAMNELCFI